MSDGGVIGELLVNRIDRHIVEPFFAFLGRRSAATRILLAVGVGGLLVALGSWGMWSLHTYTRLMAPTLGQELETNDMPYKGLEAFLLSSIDHRAEGIWGPELTATEVRAVLGRLAARNDLLKSTSRTPCLPPLELELRSNEEQQRLSREKGDEWRSSVVVWRTPGRRDHFQTEERGRACAPATQAGPNVTADEASPTSTEQATYLFLSLLYPMFMVGSQQYEGPRDLTPAAIQSLLQGKEPGTWSRLGVEVLAAKCVGDSILQRMDFATIDGMPVAQSYFMGDRGTFAVRDNQSRRTGSYRNLFRKGKYFADRRYFWGAIDGARRVGDFDYVTAPYIDYAAMGVVRTYAIAQKLEGGHTCVVAFDCVVPGGDEKLVERATELRPPWRRFWSLIRHGRRETIARFSLGRADGPVGIQWKSKENVPSWFEDEVERSKALDELGQLVGNIVPRPGQQGKDGYEFAVPIRSEKASQGGVDWTHFIVVQVDLQELRSAWLAGVVTVILGFFFGGLLSYFYHEYVAEKREQRKVLSNVSSVMHDAETPFAWFDSENRFESANREMAAWLLYGSVDDLMRHVGGTRRTFRELLAPWDRSAYDRTLERSAKGQSTEPYWCHVRRCDGTYVEVLAHGERMPLEFARGGTGPHRFGTFLRWRTKDGVVRRGRPPRCLDD